MTAPWSDILWYIAGGVPALAGLALCVWALFWDRCRGRERCPKCWYSMEAVQVAAAGRVCPECGWAAGNPRQLHKTRRRWGSAGAGVVALILGTGAMLTPKVQRDGAWSLVPTPLLLAVVNWRWEAEPDGWRRIAHHEAKSRFESLTSYSEEPAPWYLQWAIDRYLTQLTEFQVLTVNPVWPLDGHVFAEIHVPSIIGYCTDIRWRHAGSARWNSVCSGYGHAMIDLGSTLDVTRDAHEIEIELLQDDIRLWRGVRQFAVESGARTGTVVDVIDANDVACHVADALHFDFDIDDCRGVRHLRWFEDDNDLAVSLGLRTEIIHAGNVVAHGQKYLGRGMVDPRTPVRWGPQMVGLDWLPGAPPRPSWQGPTSDHRPYSLRVRGLPELAASEVLSFGWHGTGRPRAWGGEFTVVFANDR